MLVTLLQSSCDHLKCHQALLNVPLGYKIASGQEEKRNWHLSVQNVSLVANRLKKMEDPLTVEYVSQQTFLILQSTSQPHSHPFLIWVNWAISFLCSHF